MNIKQEISDYPGFYRKDGHINGNLTRKSNRFMSSDLCVEINKKLSFLPISTPLSEKIYCILNDINSQKICKICNNAVTFIDKSEGYHMYCSAKCSASDSELKDKKKQTCIKKYGVPHHLKSPYIIKKRNDTNLRKYGVKNIKQRYFDSDLKDILFDKMAFIKFATGKSMVMIACELSIDNTTVSQYVDRYQCRDIIKSVGSYPEQLLAEYIKNTYGTKIILNSKNIIPPKEIDIYLPEYNLAIEFNGLHWHSPNRYDSKEHWFDYHENKIIACREKGIKLLHIWEKYLDHKQLIDDAIDNKIDNNLKKVLNEVKWA